MSGIFSSVAAAVLIANMPLSGETWPPYMTGERLLVACGSEDPAEKGLCIGYILGVADVLGGPGAKVDGIYACLPGGETTEELVELVKDYLAANRQLANLKADGLVAYALSLSFPCE
ncbi:Rap1a/Tai family immunity protein [Pelagibius sp. Alg239-R121]|uniref:Rap1a/Tai family immunity protein n=1 Tax=Pelagibius sp. Alg239-R121 TaxID=2993448 RepID=UPI0024A642EB|nr:Rap1a/Tai family immunity protein [Pelagibius sp. Alg239-R121]